MSGSSVSVLSRILPSTVTSEDALKCGTQSHLLLPRQSSINSGDHCGTPGHDGHSTGAASGANTTDGGPPTPTHSEISECAKGKQNCSRKEFNAFCLFFFLF